MVHGIRSPKWRKTKEEPRISRHLKMVGRVIRMGALLSPPTDDGDNKGTANNDNIVRQTKSLLPSMPHQHKHRRGRMTTPATKQVPNDKRILPPAPHEDIPTTTKQ